MMFGRRKRDGTGGASESDTESPAGGREDGGPEDDVSNAATGPHDLSDLDSDRETVARTRLDLGSVLIALPEGGQLQVEMSQAGSPQAVHIVTQFGRITIAAYAAPKSPGQWREVAADLASSLRSDQAETRVEDGPWGRELVGVTANADLRFIGVDGYRWMVRCVLAGPSGAVAEGAPLVQLAHSVLRETVVDRGSEPHPVRTPLPVVLPQVLADQLAAAAQQQAAVAQQQAAQQQAAAGRSEQPPIAPTDTVGDAAAQQQQQVQPNAADRERVPRRGASGSAIQQLGG